MSLNDLFVQILQSEQKAKERKNLLNEVKNEIAKVQEQLKKVQEDCISAQGQLVVKLQHQTEAELSLVWLKHREVILTDQLAHVTKDSEARAQELSSIEVTQARDHENFIKEITSFNQTHDLCGGGREQREAEARQHLHELKQQEQRLLAELSDYRRAQAMRGRLSAEKIELKAEIDKLQGTLEGLHKQLEQKSVITKNLDGVKGQVASLPQNDTEFLRLRGKLDACHDEGLEEMCHALQQEIDHLQRKRWQKQLQRQSNQASSSSTSSVQSRNSGPKKAQKRQVQPNTRSFSDQLESINTWSSFHVTHSTQQTPTRQDASSVTNNNNQQVRPLPTMRTNNYPPVSSTATQSTTAVSVKEEPPLRPGGGVDKPNLAKMRRGIESRGAEKPSEKPASMAGTRQFHFRQTTPYDRQKSVRAGLKQPSALNPRSAACERGDDKVDGDCSERSNSSGLAQVPGNVKKVRFRY